MIDALFVRNFVTFISGVSPILALLMINSRFLNGAKRIVALHIGLVCFALYVAFFFPNVDSLTVPSVLVLYPLFVIGFNLLFLGWFGISHFSRSFAVSIMLSFVITEMHELPAIIFGYFSLPPLTPEVVFLSFAPIYALIIACIAFKTFRISPDPPLLLLLAVTIAVLFAFYFRFPLIDINAIPVMAAYIKRIFCFVILASIFMFWGDPR